MSIGPIPFNGNAFGLEKSFIEIGTFLGMQS